jgi:hypothetical protein
MKRIPLVIAAVLAAAALSACGGGPDAAPAVDAAPSIAAAPDARGDEAVVEAVFRSYYQALMARDFATACALNAPETNAKLVANMAAQGTRAGTCEEALAAVYALPGASLVADGVGNTAQVKDITVDGDTATISWSFETRGRRQPVDTGLRRIDGQWRLLATA